ncbi:hypothetical protein HAZT_HAZT002668 [Hyalella azteca]|nr:hypothetical protein HAZT_HAZT002668 [Hyalella azteca]
MPVLPLRYARRFTSCWWVLLPHQCSYDAESHACPLKTTARACSSFKASLYDVLRISPNATQAQIKHAYYKQSMKHHPDLHSGSVEAAEKFRSISEAYEVLGDETKRKSYDLKFHGIGPEPTVASGKAPNPLYRMKRRRGNTHFNFDAWEQAHYGDATDAGASHWWRTQTPEEVRRAQQRYWQDAERDFHAQQEYERQETRNMKEHHEFIAR